VELELTRRFENRFSTYSSPHVRALRFFPDDGEHFPDFGD
jgi:hypothetical protein